MSVAELNFTRAAHAEDVDPAAAGAVALVDFGSTFTKLRVVSPAGELLAAVQHRTTVETDVFDGLRGAFESLERERPGTDVGRVLACSSAGGGLRLAVVGLVEDLTAEAARQAALSAGARVVAVVSGGLRDPEQARAVMAAHPDIVLLAGGTDGGDGEVLRRSAAVLAGEAGDVPVVVAGNVEAQLDAVATLTRAGHHVVRAPNVMPQISTVDPDGVRDVVREIFIRHVIGGKLRGGSGRLEELVRMATPDAVLTGVELLADVLDGLQRPRGVVVVDVGGATTDVHSTLPASVEHASGLHRSLLPQAPSARTVEADLGMRWNATGVIEAAVREGLLDDAERAVLEPAAARRADEPSYLPDTPDEVEIDRRLARVAIAVALRRHVGRRRLTLSREGAVLAHDGRDLREAPLLLGTGGVFRSLGPDDLAAGLEAAREGGADLLLPTAATAGVDDGYVLAAAGVLAGHDASAARLLLERELVGFITSEQEDHGFPRD